MYSKLNTRTKYETACHLYACASHSKSNDHRGCHFYELRPSSRRFRQEDIFFLQKIIANTTAIEETVIGYTRLVDAMLTTTMCPTLLQVAPNS